MVASTVPDLPLPRRGDLCTLTVRNIPSAVDETITEQARKAGRSKSDFLQEFLVTTFGERLGNFIRTSELVALMDREMARMMDSELRESPYDVGLTLDGHREFCRILGILSEADLQRIMIGGTAPVGARAAAEGTDPPVAGRFSLLGPACRSSHAG